MKSNLKTILTGHNGAIYDLIDIPEDDMFISTGGDGFIVGWKRDGSNPDGVLLAKADKQIFALGKYRDLLLAGAMTGELYWINKSAKEIIKNTKYHKGSIFDILPLNDHIFTVSGDGCLAKWDPIKKEIVLTLQLSNQGLRKLIFDPFRKQIIVASSDNNVYFVDPVNLHVKNQIINMHDNSVFSLCLLDANTLLTGSRDACLRSFNLNSLKMTAKLPAHLYSINEIINMGSYIATGSRDKRVRIWDQNFKLHSSIDISKEGHLNSVNSLLWMDDLLILWSCSDDRTIRAFNF